MGKRTKFQVREIAQLTLSVNSHRPENYTHMLTTHACKNLPKVSYLNTTFKLFLIIIVTSYLYFKQDCVLDDENRLPDIKFSSESAGSFPKLNCLQQAAILNAL